MRPPRAHLTCPNHQHAKKIQPNIDSVKNLTGGDRNANVSDVVTSAVTGSASSTSVTDSKEGTSTPKENDVGVPRSKTRPSPPRQPVPIALHAEPG